MSFVWPAGGREQLSILLVILIHGQLNTEPVLFLPSVEQNMILALLVNISILSGDWNPYFWPYFHVELQQKKYSAKLHKMFL